MQNYPQFPDAEPARRGLGAVWWFLIGTCLLLLLMCGGVVGGIAYIGVTGPDTAVYTGNQVPARFRDTMEEVGALEPGEQILYFYSDAITDIRDGFSFVSDRKVAVYSAGSVEPLTTIRFEEIRDADLYRNESFFEDSVITLEIESGVPVSFPVSSEYDRDQQFYEAITSRIEPAK